MLKKDIQTRKLMGRAKEKLETLIYTEIAPLKTEAWVTREPLHYKNRTDGKYALLNIGDCWGALFDCAWFRFSGKVPKEAAGRHVVLKIDISGEGCVFDGDGNPSRGITSVTSRNDWPLGMWGKRILQVSDCASGEEKIEIWIDAGCNDLEGQYNGEGIIREASVCICDDAFRKFYYDYSVLISLYDGLVEDGNFGAASALMKDLRMVTTAIAPYTPNVIDAMQPVLDRLLSEKNETPDFYMTSIGHSHIDLLFLWPKRETLRKGARTYSTVLDLMEKYKDRYDYKFCASQPQIYQWMQQEYPVLFDRIKESVRKGNWECAGAMWVESDTNLPSGESLVRQILYGKRYFRKEFGKEMEVCFIPDCFGFSGALPQLLVKSNTPYFLTQKMCWNDTNRFPLHTFMWQGIDGSRVLAHMLPEDSYSSAAVPQIAMKARRNFADKGLSDEAMQLFGVGDGGGGPGPEHLERLIRQRSLKGVPPIRQGFISDFFHRIEKNKAAYRRWSGELYLERHQGTYTSIAKMKRYNRKTEIALRECEFACVLAEKFAGSAYPREELTGIWEEILLYQFHDCLPGSSINRVYEEAYSRYEILSARLGRLASGAYDALAQRIDISGAKDPVIIFNSLPFERNERIKAGERWVEVKVPAMGWTAVDLDSAAGVDVSGVNADGNVLENGKIRIEFDEDGAIYSIYDRTANREVLKNGGRGNLLSVYDDRGTCWDIDKNYLNSNPQHLRLLKKEPYSDGLRTGFVFDYAYESSSVRQTVFLYPDSKNIVFNTHADWKEEYKMLRTGFDADVQAATAKCEIQFGFIDRPTHTNTSWDAAKFEVCAHRFVDIGDGAYGVALLNDCKYGYRVADGKLDLNLIRSQMCPSLGADKVTHEFKYALYPHCDDLVKGNVIREGLLLNYPAWFSEPGGYANSNDIQDKRLSSRYSMLSLSSPNIFVESVKKAEDSENYIVRLYEAGGQKTGTDIALDGFIARNKVNLLEEPIEEYNNENAIQLDFGPFEIHSLLVASDPGAV